MCDPTFATFKSISPPAVFPLFLVDVLPLASNFKLSLLAADRFSKDLFNFLGFAVVVDVPG